MPFKKHNWFDYNSSGEIIEITVKDWNGRKLDFFRCNIKEDSNKIISILKKYGFNPDNKINIKQEVKEEKEWLDKEREKEEVKW